MAKVLRAAALHLVNEAGAIVFVPNLEHIRVRKISLAERIVKRRGHQITHWLLDARTTSKIFVVRSLIDAWGRLASGQRAGW
jgi:hypothetical protein